jgi:hypothetical protein
MVGINIGAEQMQRARRIAWTATAMQIVQAAGFDALDSGSLSDSWRQQPGTLLIARNCRRKSCNRRCDRPTGLARRRIGTL